MVWIGNISYTFSALQGMCVLVNSNNVQREYLTIFLIQNHYHKEHDYWSQLVQLRLVIHWLAFFNHILWIHMQGYGRLNDIYRYTQGRPNLIILWFSTTYQLHHFVIGMISFFVSWYMYISNCKTIRQWCLTCIYRSCVCNKIVAVPVKHFSRKVVFADVSNTVYIAKFPNAD